MNALRFLLAAGLFPAGLLAQDLSQAAGAWRLLQFSTPSALPLQFNASQELVGVGNIDNFEMGEGLLNVAGDGTFSGTVGGPVTGQFSVAGQGIVQVSVPGQNPLSFRINNTHDFQCSVNTDPGGWQDLEMLVRAPNPFVPDLLANTSWSLLSFESPARLFVTKNPQGVVTEVREGLNFWHTFGTMTLDATGGVSGVLEDPFTGTCSYAGDGLVAVDIVTAEGSFALPWFINSTQDILLSYEHVLSGEDNYQDIILAVRGPETTQLADLAGLWRVASFKNPYPLRIARNTQGQISQISNWNSFGTGYRDVIAGHDGFFVARGMEVESGAFSVSGPGNVTVTVSGETIGLKLNAAKSVMVGVATSQDEHELLVLTRAPASSAPAQDFGLRMTAATGALVLEWASGPTRSLQSSTNLVDWEAVPGTIGQHSFSATPSATGTTLYRVVETK